MRMRMTAVAMMMFLAIPVNMFVAVMVLMSFRIVDMLMAVLCLFLQNHIKITDFQPVFYQSLHFYLIPAHRKLGKGLAQVLFSGSEIQKSRHSHISADAGAALQI